MTAIGYRSMCVMVGCACTMNGADWSKRYPRIVEEAARIKGSAVMDAEVVCLVMVVIRLFTRNAVRRRPVRRC
jgi:ATP-dependent DNA ligase